MRLFRIGLVFLSLAFALVTADRLWADEPASASLQKAGDRAYLALKKRDTDRFISMLSQNDSFYISLRRAVWTGLTNENVGKSPNEAFPHMLDDLSSYGWEERQMEFDTRHPDLRPRLKKALERIAKQMDNTYGGVGVATHQMDAWNVRELGPSASGKMASSSFWYIYFRKEGKTWKIWKLELAVH